MDTVRWMLFAALTVREAEILRWHVGVVALSNCQTLALEWDAIRRTLRVAFVVLNWIEHLRLDDLNGFVSRWHYCVGCRPGSTSIVVGGECDEMRFD